MTKRRQITRGVALVGLVAAAALGASAFGCNEVLELPDRATKPHIASCEGGTCTCVAGFGDCDGDLEKNGCEAKFEDDPLNCGRCGHDCLGGECTTEGCGMKPVLWEELETHQGPVAGDGLVYVVNVSTHRVMKLGPADTELRDHGGFEGLSIGMKRNELGVFFASYPHPEEFAATGPFHVTIHRVDAAGVHPLASLVTGEMQITDFAVTEDAIWISGRNYDNFGFFELVRFDLATGAQQLVTEEIFGPVDFDDGHLHWASEADLIDMVPGGSPTTLIDATPGDFNYFVYGPGSYYGIDSELITRFDRTSLAEEELAVDALLSVDPDGPTLLFLDPINGTTNRWPPGGEPEVLASGMHFDEGDWDYYYVTSDERGWYWADRFGVFVLARP